MATNILTFRVEMEATDGQVFRVIEISDQRTVLELMCTALVAFDAKFNKLMQIRYEDLAFALPEEVDQNEALENADKIRINNLPLSVSEELTLIYDFNQNWVFKLTLIDKSEMEKGTGNNYPRLIDGAGPEIVEDRHAQYEIIRRSRFLGEKERQLANKICEILGGVPEISDFNLEEVKAQFKRNVKKAVKDCRDQVLLQIPEPYEMNFRIYLKGYGRKLWRKIIVSSNDTLNDLIQIILMSFEAEIYHLYDIQVKGRKFGNPIDIDFRRIQDARYIYLYELNLRPDDKMLLTYDYGENWEFTVTYKGDGDMVSDLSKYPKILGGRGWGILEDDYYHFAELISGTELSEDTIDEFMEYYDEVPDLTEFDLEENDDFVRDQMQKVYRKRGIL